ncbi:MAG: beta-ketoacyl-[acyl-carrier-protein] synthase family protein [Rhizobiaceae bacterium]|nr:beta-ketoacyl-[acyl-carrier-protein] synthase family protein [Rhizobiaceae bacterium]
MRKRVVVTGIGGLCGLGNDVASIWAAMRASKSAIGPLQGSGLDDIKIRTACQVTTFPIHNIDRRQTVSMDRFSLFAVIAAREAMAQSGLKISEAASGRIGVTMGVGVFGADTADVNYRKLLIEGKPRADIFAVPKIMPGAAAGQISMDLGLKGPTFGVTSACSSSNHAFATALDQLLLGRADVMLAGGTEAPLSWGVLKGWDALRIASPDTCRPFSANRQGLVLGEGAGVAVLETYEHAMARGATILAELAGVGMSADASDIVAPTVEGPAAAMRACLADAGLNPEDVDYLNAHGTGTKANDQIETVAIKQVFGDQAKKLSVSSTKSMHAHCLGASGALEMIACVKAIQEGVVPPTANYLEPDPECDLDVTPNVARERKIRVAMSNGFAFGGTNAVVAFKAV